MRVLVTGSRNWPDSILLSDTLSNLVADNLSHDKMFVVVHGDAKHGADRMASEWCEWVQPWAELAGCTVIEERHPAAWRPNGQFDRSAGFRRNQQMVALGADVCLAFISKCVSTRCTISEDHGSHGARHTADIAQDAGIEVRRYFK